MSAYFDTSVLVQWYVLEPGSAAAVRLRAGMAPPVLLSPFHRVELTAALRPLLTEILAVQETGAAQLDRIEFLGTLDGHLARLESTMAGVDFGPDEHLFDGLADSRADGVTALAELEDFGEGPNVSYHLVGPL